MHRSQLVKGFRYRDRADTTIGFRTRDQETRHDQCARVVIQITIDDIRNESPKTIQTFRVVHQRGNELAGPATRTGRSSILEPLGDRLGEGLSVDSHVRNGLRAWGEEAQRPEGEGQTASRLPH